MPEMPLTLRAARVNLGFTVKEVAKRVGKNPETISYYERNSTNIPRDLMVDLLNLYRVKYDQVFFGKESDFHGQFRDNKTSA